MLAHVTEGNSIFQCKWQQSATSTQLKQTSQLLRVRGVGTDVNEEALEDGGIELVRRAVLDRMAGGLAQATDISRFSSG